ncbi:hypothetical protein M271_34535 [Streptomyces rapamycinicus NRRL 5491]|nr:hypothetical protein M271_34535 [Streptomyces rapamycinicus NRRL 5491]
MFQENEGLLRVGVVDGVSQGAEGVEYVAAQGFARGLDPFSGQVFGEVAAVEIAEALHRGQAVLVGVARAGGVENVVQLPQVDADPVTIKGVGTVRADDHLGQCLLSRGAQCAA